MYFKDLKVVEFSSVLAGPAVGMFFAELGANVLKVENRSKGGDMTRKWKLPGEESEDLSAYFCAVNYQKQYIDLDLQTKEGRTKAYQLIKKADIILSNFKEGDDKKLGLTNEILKEINPSIILAQISGFAQNKNRVAFDVVLQAETGYISMNGTNAENLAKLPVAFIDLFAAHQLKEGILIALLNRHKTGKGAVVRVNLQEAALASLANQASNYLMLNHLPQPMGTQHPNIAPYGDLFVSADQKKLLFAVGTDKQFESLCHTLELPELINDEKYHSNPARVKNRASLNARLQTAVSQANRAELMEKLIGVNVPCAAVRTLEEVFQNDVAQNLILKEEIDGQPTQRMKTAVFQITEL